jgi:hypothetical protein
VCAYVTDAEETRIKCFIASFDRSIDDAARSAHIDLLKEARIVNDEDCGEVINCVHSIETARQRFRLSDVADADVRYCPNTHFEAAINETLDKGRAHDTRPPVTKIILSTL